MKPDDRIRLLHIAEALEAAIGFVRRMKKDDVIEVVEFNSQVRVPQPFTNDVSALERAIRQTSVNGSTSGNFPASAIPMSSESVHFMAPTLLRHLHFAPGPRPQRPMPSRGGARA